MQKMASYLLYLKMLRLRFWTNLQVPSTSTFKAYTSNEEFDSVAMALTEKHSCQSQGLYQGGMSGHVLNSRWDISEINSVKLDVKKFPLTEERVRMAVPK